MRVPPIGLAGTLNVPTSVHGLVAHGNGSSRFSPRNNVVAEALNADGIVTLLFDLLTTDEESNGANIFDIPLLAERLVDAVRWLDHQPAVRDLPLGLFGASTGAAAALMAAAQLGDRAAAIMSRGGRPDLAGDALDMVRTPTLLIVGGDDLLVIDLNRLALERLKGPKALEIVSGASHLFVESGALKAVVDRARDWLKRYLRHAQEPTSQNEHRRE